MLRIDQLAVFRAASRSIGTAGWASSCVSVAVAPILSVPPATSSVSRPALRRPITAPGSEIPSFISGMATVPPAITSSSGPCVSSRPNASGIDRGKK